MLRPLSLSLSVSTLQLRGVRNRFGSGEGGKRRELNAVWPVHVGVVARCQLARFVGRLSGRWPFDSSAVSFASCASFVASPVSPQPLRPLRRRISSFAWIDIFLPRDSSISKGSTILLLSLSLSLSSHFTHSGYIFHVEANFFHLHGMFLLSEFILKLRIILILILELNGKRAKRMAS